MKTICFEIFDSALAQQEKEGLWLMICICIHPSIFHAAYPTESHGEPGAFPRILWAQGWGYSGQDANLSLGTERFQPTVSRE